MSKDNNVLNVTCTQNSNQSILLVDLFMFASINSFSIKWISFHWNFACLRNRFDYSTLYKYNSEGIFDTETIVRSDYIKYQFLYGIRYQNNSFILHIIRFHNINNAFDFILEKSKELRSDKAYSIKDCKIFSLFLFRSL